MNITEAFIDYLINCNDRISKQDLVKAKYCLLDYLGVTYAGAHENTNLLSEISPDEGPCNVIGTEYKTDAPTSAFLNGFDAHTIEMDDGHRYGAIHLGAVVISAVIAVAQEQRAKKYICSVDMLLRGIIIGYEAAVRCGMSMQPGHKKRGYHTSGTCGTIGAAVGIGFMLQYERNQMKSTISGAATSAAGILEIQEDASEMKPYNIAHAAMAAVTAAKVGAAGLCPPDDILGGPRGVLRILTDTFSENKLLEVSDELEIQRIYIKPYAACRHCHPAMEAAIQIREANGLMPENIDQVVVEIYEPAVQGHDHTQIQGIASAKLSIPYCVAAAYLLEEGGPGAFTDENTDDQTLLSLAEKVTVSPKDEFTKLYPEKRVSEVHIFSGEKECVYRVDFAKGDPENPMTEDEIKDKFTKLMQWAQEQKRASEILSAFEHLEENELYSILLK